MHKTELSFSSTSSSSSSSIKFSGLGLVTNRYKRDPSSNALLSLPLASSMTPLSRNFCNNFSTWEQIRGWCLCVDITMGNLIFSLNDYSINTLIKLLSFYDFVSLLWVISKLVWYKQNTNWILLVISQTGSRVYVWCVWSVNSII